MPEGEKIVEKRLQPKELGIGFHASVEQSYKPTQEEVLDAIEPEDLRRFGLIPEFIGRFPVLASLEPLTVEVLIQILTEPRNALVKQYKKIFKYENVDLEFTEDALKSIAKKALQRGTGARGLRGVMEHILRRTMYEIPSLHYSGQCFIDEQVVNGEKDAVLEADKLTGEQLMEDINVNDKLEAKVQGQNSANKEIPLA